VDPEIAKLLARRTLPGARRGYDRDATDALLAELKRCLEGLLAERSALESRAAELAEQLAALEVERREASEPEGDTPQSEPAPEPVEGRDPSVEVAEPGREQTEAEDVAQSAAEMHQAAVLDEFAQANEELERLAEEARARVRALAERLSSDTDSEA
jgi:cell division septum initiation protein DivIVA